MPTPAAVLERLLAGNHRFVEGKREHTYRERERRAALVEEQRPLAAVLGCSDSRVPPELVFDQGLGDLFTVRVAGNTAADALVVASVEFAVSVLGVGAIVVLGHERCAAVEAAIAVANGAEFPAYLSAVTDPILPAVPTESSSVEDALPAAIVANVEHSVNMLSQNAVLRGAVERGDLAIVGRVYQLESGRVVSLSG
jgi:carbonic anhydrase